MEGGGKRSKAIWIEEEKVVYSSAVVHNNRSSRALCGVCRQRSREGERDMEGFAWVRWGPRAAIGTYSSTRDPDSVTKAVG